MQQHIKEKKGDSIDNAIFMEAQDTIQGVIEEHKHIC